MRNSLSDNYFYKRLIIFKPSTTFWITSFFCFSIWIYLGPLNWRHYDDYDPLNNFFSWLGVYGFKIYEPNSLSTNLFNNFIKLMEKRLNYKTYYSFSLGTTWMGYLSSNLEFNISNNICAIYYFWN